MNFFNYLTGPNDPVLFAVCLFFFAPIGILFVLLMGTRLRDPRSLNSPQRFSWNYLWNDNVKRILASILAVYITLRFMTELTGWQLNEWRAVIVGTAWDGIALFLKQKTDLLDPKKPQ